MSYAVAVIIIVMVALSIYGINLHSPEYQKYKDAQESICKKQCEPRQIESWNSLRGCQCKVDKK